MSDNLTQVEIEKIIAKFNELISEQLKALNGINPPQIIVYGFTGVGKSSVIVGLTGELEVVKKTKGVGLTFNHPIIGAGAESKTIGVTKMEGLYEGFELYDSGGIEDNRSLFNELINMISLACAIKTSNSN